MVRARAPRDTKHPGHANAAPYLVRMTDLPQSQTMHRWLHALARSPMLVRAALLAPWLAVAVLGAGVLRHGATAVRHDVDAAARTQAIALAQIVAGRLDTQYRELQFAGVALLGPHGDPRDPGANTARALRDFSALHPNLYAFNVQSADGDSIVWSTHRQSQRPITDVRGFTALPAQRDFLLGTMASLPALVGYVVIGAVGGRSLTQGLAGEWHGRSCSGRHTTDIATIATTDQATDIHFCTGLCKRKVRWPETYFGFFPKHFLYKIIKCLF